MTDSAIEVKINRLKMLDAIRDGSIQHRVDHTGTEGAPIVYAPGEYLVAATKSGSVTVTTREGRFLKHTDNDTGSLYATTKRLVFTGNLHPFTLAAKDIGSVGWSEGSDFMSVSSLSGELSFTMGIKYDVWAPLGLRIEMIRDLAHGKYDELSRRLELD